MMTGEDQDALSRRRPTENATINNLAEILADRLITRAELMQAIELAYKMGRADGALGATDNLLKKLTTTAAVQ